MSGDLARRGIAAALWNYLGNAAKAGSQFVVAIILARLLGPAAFGVVAVGWLVVGAGAMFGDLGFSAAIIQRATITRRDADFAFTMQLLTAVLITLAAIVAAPWLAGFFDQPEASDVVRVMAASLILRAFGQTPTALLQRDLRFSATQIIAVATYVAGFGGVGIAMAWLGFGAWSLVGAQIAQTGASSVAVLLLTRQTPRLALRPTHKDIAGTGFLVILANASSWCLGNVDSAIVGHVGGPVVLGLYNRANALAAMPATLITSGLQGVVLSAASRVQTATAKLRTAFLGSVALFVLLGGSTLATMALTAETIVMALLGAAWRGAIPLLTALSVAMIAQGMLAFAGPILTATGNVRKEARAQWMVLPLMTVLVYLAARESAAVAAWAVAACYSLRLAVLARKVHESLEFRLGETVQALLPPACAAAATGVATGLADVTLGFLPPVPRLAADVAAAGLVLCVCILFLRAHLLRGPLGQVMRSSSILPPRLRGWLFP